MMDTSSTLVNNRYNIVRELGKGGFGATFLVEDKQLPSGKRCVLKQLTPIENNEETYTLIKQRFEREAVILEELGNMSPQIPSLYAYFTENSSFYLVQEYIEGETLTQRVVSQGVMSDAAVREWLRAILPVLNCMHEKRIIHRDIKPDNIILRQLDHMPVLIDFGAVREAMGIQAQANGKSTQSIVIGTPGFMASEQAIGRAVFASDIYSLGLTAVYALTGRIPQDLATDPMTGEVEWRQYAPSVSAGLAGVIDRAISLGVQARFSTVAQMADALVASGTPSVMPVMPATQPGVIPGTVMSMPSGMPSGGMPTQVSQSPPSGPQQTVVMSPGSQNNPSQYPQQPPSQQYSQQPQSQYSQQPQSQYSQQYSQQPQSQYPQQPQSQYPQSQPGYAQPAAPRKFGGIPIAAVAIGAGLLFIGMGALLNNVISSKSCGQDQEKVDDKCVDKKKSENSASGSGSSTPKTLRDVGNVPGLTVRYGGSTSFASLRSKAIVDKIQAAHPQFILSYTEPTRPDKPGSGNGIKMLIEGQMSVAQSSRAVKDEEFAKAKERNITLDQVPVAIDGIAIYVNNQASIQSLTLAQVKDIFTGKVTNWKEVGGADLAIVPISRDPKDGGTPEYFEEKVMAKEPFATSVQPYVRDTTEELRKVAQSPGAISYAAAPMVCSQATVKALSIAKDAGQPPISPCNGKQVNKADFSKDVYPITRRLFVVVRKDGKLDEQAGNAYANLLLSDEGQQLVEEAGLVPLRVR